MESGEFASASLQAGLGLIAVLFGVFGFLYSAYCAYSYLVTPEYPQRAPVVTYLCTICRIIALLNVASGAVVLLMLYKLHPAGAMYVVTAGLLGLITITICALCLWMAFRMMD